MIDDNILVYKVVQSIPFCLFTIANEYAFDTFGIQLYPCLAHEHIKNNQKHINDLWKVCIHTKPLIVSC
jgi:hypothetical protein